MSRVSRSVVAIGRPEPAKATEPKPTKVKTKKPDAASVTSESEESK